MLGLTNFVEIVAINSAKGLNFGRNQFGAFEPTQGMQVKHLIAKLDATNKTSIISSNYNIFKYNQSLRDPYTQNIKLIPAYLNDYVINKHTYILINKNISIKISDQQQFIADEILTRSASDGRLLIELPTGFVDQLLYVPNTDNNVPIKPVVVTQGSYVFSYTLNDIDAISKQLIAIRDSNRKVKPIPPPPPDPTVPNEDTLDEALEELKQKQDNYGLRGDFWWWFDTWYVFYAGYTIKKGMPVGNRRTVTQDEFNKLKKIFGGYEWWHSGQTLVSNNTNPDIPPVRSITHQTREPQIKF